MVAEPFLISTKSLVAGVAERWKAQYYQSGEWICGDDKRLIYEKLAALPPGASESEVVAIIGNQSWTAVSCDSCFNRVSEVVQVGEEMDYDSATVRLCRDCCRKAYLLFSELSPDSAIKTVC